MNFIKNKANNQSGSAMLLAIFVMGAMLIVALGTSSLAVNQIRQSREIKKSIIAFYAAEGGVEDGLFQVRKNNKKVEDLQTYQPSSSPYETNATTTLNFYDIEEIVYDHLKVNEIVSLDLYNIDTLGSSGIIKSIRLQWDGKPQSWLDLSWRSLNPPNYYSEFINLQKKLIPYSDGSEKLVDLTTGQAEEYTMHSLQIKALYDEVKNLRIKAYSDIGGTEVNKVNIPSHIYITSKGKYPQNISDISSALQVITVSLPEKTPLAPLFDYVVFSEMDIKKQIIYTGSERGQLIYEQCGPYIIYPECYNTFENPPVTENIIVQNIGIEPATITNTSISPAGVYTISNDGCRNQTLQYNQTCTIQITAIRAPGSTADLSVATSSAILMLLNQTSGR